jgi:hypothetical protein
MSQRNSNYNKRPRIHSAGAVILVHGQQEAEALAALLTTRLREKRLNAALLLERIKEHAQDLPGTTKADGVKFRKRITPEDATMLEGIECISAVAIPLEVPPTSYNSYQTRALIDALEAAQETELSGTVLHRVLEDRARAAGEELVQFGVHPKLVDWYNTPEVQETIQGRGRGWYYIVGLEPFSLLGGLFLFRKADLTVFAGAAKEDEMWTIQSKGEKGIRTLAKRELSEESALTESEVRALQEWYKGYVNVKGTCIYTVLYRPPEGDSQENM